jgi:hypothetical protein
VYASVKDQSTKETFLKRFPAYGIVALCLCLASWACSWLRIDPFFRYSFFPLWFGFILFLDALSVTLHGTSLLSRMRWRMVWLFLVSSVFWWIFEWFNVPVQNWHYRFDHPYSPLAYFIISSIDFSTVLPAVFEISEILSSFPLLHPRLPLDDPGPRLSLPLFIVLEGLGVLCLVLPWIFPHYCFPLIWFSLIFILDPINNLARRKSAFGHLLAQDWRFFVVPLSALVCGFFWEMWNYLALPKWYYTVPFIGFWKVFEMPLLGYSGYLPFALELFALYQFILLITRRRQDYLVI